MANENLPIELESQISGLRAVINQLGSLFGQLETAVKPSLASADESLAKTRERVKDLTKEVGSFRDTLQKDFSGAVKNALKNGSDFAGVFDRMRTSLEDLVIQMGVVNPALNFLFGENKSTLSTIGEISGGNLNRKGSGIFGSLLGGIFDLFEGRALGGPVKGGVPYIVGERGPELFVPPTAGRIAPNVGGNPISITMNISTNNAESFRASQAQVAASVLDSVRRAQRIR
jgi:hypothetical protein